MPRPKTKTQLLTQSESNLHNLLSYVDELPNAQRLGEFPPGTLNRNIADVLAHLHHWHLMFLQWYEIGMRGDKPAIPAEGFTWKTVPALNKQIQREYHDRALDDVKLLLCDSHDGLIDIVERHTNAELFEKKRYHWTGTTSLGAYLISATSSHYDWALKFIRRALK